MECLTFALLSCLFIIHSIFRIYACVKFLEQMLICLSRVKINTACLHYLIEKEISMLYPTWNLHHPFLTLSSSGVAFHSYSVMKKCTLPSFLHSYFICSSTSFYLFIFICINPLFHPGAEGGGHGAPRWSHIQAFDDGTESLAARLLHHVSFR